jgi:hypothetical protein
VTALPLSVLCLALIAQSGPVRPARGSVVDGDGKPVANARVVLYAPPVAYLKVDPVEVEAKTNADGQFSLVIPPLERAVVNGISGSNAARIAVGASLARSRLERWRARRDEREISFGGKRNF